MFFCSSVFWDRFQLFSHVQFGGEGREGRELIFSTSIQETSLSVFIMTKKNCLTEQMFSVSSLYKIVYPTLKLADPRPYG